MYRAKELDTNFCVFDPGMHAKVMQRLRRESELRRALEREEFILHYQPQVRLETGRIVGVEVLARWRHPGRGLVGAHEFIWDAEDSGLIIPLGRWVLEEACRQAAAWQERYPGDPPLAVAVNISARQLHRMDLPQDVSRILRETGLNPRGLVLEVTEGSTIEDLQMGNDTLGDLKAPGVQVAIDDFGTGYSSLSYLRRLPADVLKIDKSFVHALGESAEDTAILRTIVELAHTLGMEVKAEGVETPEQAALVRESGCDMAQGNHFFAPLPSTEVTKLFAAG